MLEIEIDGKKAQVPDGSTVMDAAQQLGVYVPHFCYHKKLSIAANCRMCLVQVEKAPKPLPACATPVTNGMKVMTHSELAVKAQKGVMEFLLINHPLDCPICDQGGECQLQDMSVGYGGVQSRYSEEKRVVFHKNIGSLISMEEMSRCIHCTRCVRFGQEIAGVMELGMTNRNMHSEISTFVGKTVDSELSGNMIDLCPVGALTSKPFRYTARSWELQRRRSVSPHDSVGANLVVQVKHDKVMRVLPLENEEVNECWISDKDRFSYEALNSDQRLTKPMVKQDGQWHEVDWNIALEYVANGLKDVAAENGADALAALASPHATLEELYLLQKLLRALGSENIDFRPRQVDFRLDAMRQGAPWLGLTLAELSQQDAVLVIGSFLRKDHPLIAQRLRQAAKKGQEVSVISVAGDNSLIQLHARCEVAPSMLANALGAVLKAVAELKEVAVPSVVADVAVCAESKRIAQSLLDGEKKAILLGNVTTQLANAADIHVLTQMLAELTGASFGYLGEAANTVGGYVAQAYSANKPAAQAMFETPKQAYVLLGLDPELDCANPSVVNSALAQAKMVVSCSSFRQDAALEYADVLLPIAPFTETSGSFVNTEGRVQSFSGVVKPLGGTRPAWKILRVLGNMLGLPGFDYMSSEEVRTEALGNSTATLVSGLNNTVSGLTPTCSVSVPSGLERVVDIPIYFADPLVRRAKSLAATKDSAFPKAYLAEDVWQALSLAIGAKVRVQQQGQAIELEAVLDTGLPKQCVRVSAAHPATQVLGSMFGAISVERA